jgi:chromosome segregation ATPase
VNTVPFFSKHSDQQFEQVQAERDAAQTQMAGLKDEGDGLRAQIQQVNTQIVDLQGKLTVEAARAKTEAEQRAVAEGQVAELQAKLKAETDARNAEAGKAQAEAARANAEANRANAEAAKAKAEADQRAAAERQVAELQGKLKGETDARNAEAGKAQAEAARANAEAAKAKDLQEENDLLLAQLHQVQEELERYYLKNKDLESSVGEVTTSLRNARYALINAKLTGTLAPQKLLASN